MADPIAPGGGQRSYRLLAVIGAVVLVLVAVVVRGRLDDNDSSGGGGGGAGGARTLVCPPDLIDACQAAAADDHDLRVRQEDPLTTANALIAATPGSAVDGDLWLAPTPWAEAVAAQRDRARQAPLTGEAVGPIARSPVLLVLYEERAAALQATTCGGEIQWKCVGDATGRPWEEVGGEAGWGLVKAGLTDPTAALGLPVLGGAAAGYLGTSDYATNDFANGLMGWLGPLAANPAGDDAVDQMITAGPGRYSAVGALEVTARTAVDRPGFRVVLPEPVATADLVVVPIGANAEDGGGADDLAGNDGLLGALAEAGWRVDHHDLAKGVDADLDLPKRDGLPSGDVLLPLLTSWQDLG